MLVWNLKWCRIWFMSPLCGTNWCLHSFDYMGITCSCLKTMKSHLQNHSKIWKGVEIIARYHQEIILTILILALICSYCARKKTNTKMEVFINSELCLRRSNQALPHYNISSFVLFPSRTNHSFGFQILSCFCNCLGTWTRLLLSVTLGKSFLELKRGWKNCLKSSRN